MFQRVWLFIKRVAPLFKNARVWLPIVGIVVSTCIADGLIAPTGRLHDFAITFLDVLGRLGLYGVAGVAGVGVVVAADWQRSRKSLSEMTEAEREDVFRKNPDVRQRWEDQQKLLATPPRDGIAGGK